MGFCVWRLKQNDANENSFDNKRAVVKLQQCLLPVRLPAIWPYNLWFLGLVKLLKHLRVKCAINELE